VWHHLLKGGEATTPFDPATTERVQRPWKRFTPLIRLIAELNSPDEASGNP
jgi:hypothetical protein